MKKPQADDLEPETFSLEFLMNTPPVELTKLELDQIVQYHRNIRADRAAAAEPGAKRKKAASAPTPTGIKKLLAKKTSTIDRRGF